MDAERIPARAWMIVMMLFCFMVINFADKAVLGLAAVPIMRDLHLNHTEFGLIGTSFFVFFSLSAVLVGFLVNRVPTKWVLAAMALSWSLCQLPMILPIGLIALVGNRVLLGLGEGPALPVALHAAYKWFPNRRRPLPTSLIALGGAVGVGIAAPGVVYIIVNYSWHAGFAMLGLAGLLWCVAWLWIGHEGPLTAEAFTTGYTRLPYTMLLTSRSMIGQVMVAFAAYWLLIIAVVWLPAYLTKSAGYTQTEVGWIVTLPALLADRTDPRRLCFLGVADTTRLLQPDRPRRACLRRSLRRRRAYVCVAAVAWVRAGNPLHRVGFFVWLGDVQPRPRDRRRDHPGRTARCHARHRQRRGDTGGSDRARGAGPHRRCRH